MRYYVEVYKSGYRAKGKRVLQQGPKAVSKE